MRNLSFAFIAVAALLIAASTAAAQPGQTYPKVRTFSGGYYGPTQAHYQYQRRYGRPWQGASGISHGHGHHHHGHGHSHHYTFGWPTYGSFGFGFGLPFVSSGFGYSCYGGASLLDPGCGLFGFSAPPLASFPLGVAATPPALSLASPGVYQPFWSPNPYVNNGLLNNGHLWQQEVPDLLTPQVDPLGAEPLSDSPVLPAPSTPQAQLRSLQQQQQGDARLQQLDYLQAYLRYKEAAGTASDRVEPHYRMGIALAGMKRFDKAVREFKRASDLDPGWLNSVTLDELLGADNHIGKVQLKQRVADWALEDAYDADRLYLLGTLLHLDGDPDRARILIDTAVALVGQQRHLTAFRADPALVDPAAANRQLGVPQSVPRRQAPDAAAPPQQPVLPTPSTPQTDDVPDVPQDPGASDPPENSSEAPRLSPQSDSILPSIQSPGGPVFPTSLR